ncbi:MAG: 3-hydroxyacyl-CoA dehydrogenase family protein [Candidatus Thorarchaeota archaeon]
MKRIAVIGAGAMGTGIAYQAARFGLEVNLNDLKQEFINNGISKIKDMVKTGVERKKLDLKAAKSILDGIHPIVDLKEAVKDVDMVVEAIFENMKVKKELFGKLDEYANPRTILATNTSSLSVTEIATATKRPEKVIGTHFFNPVYTMKLVEIVLGAKSSEETIETAIEFSKQLDKTPVKVKDSPGFIVNRILGALMGEAIKILQDGLASGRDIDTAMQLGANHPVGPLTLADFVGLDIAAATANTLHSGLGDCYATPKLLLEKVEKGELGMKSGKGFFEYTE